MAMVDTDYQFLWVDTESVHHQSDTQIYNASEVKQYTEDGTLSIPPLSVFLKIPSLMMTIQTSKCLISSWVTTPSL